MAQGNSGIQLHSRSLVGQNTKFNIYFDSVSDQTSSAVDYLVIVPKTSSESYISGAAVLPVYQGKIGLIRIFRYAISEYSWEIPRGFMDPGESAFFAAGRELKEETGLECSSENLVSLGLVAPEPGVMTARIQLIAALACGKSEQGRSDELGMKDLRFFGLKEVDQMIMDSTIQDPSTIVAVYRFSRLMESGRLKSLL